MSSFIAYLKTKSFRTNLIAALGTVFGILLIAFFSLRFYTKHGEGMNVPNLKGKSINEAVSILENLNLRYELDSVYIMDKPPGLVIEQNPDPETFVKDNRTIYLTVNTSKAPNVNFPDIEFKTLREAKAIIEGYGLKLGDTSYKPDVSRDVVLAALFGGLNIQSGESLPRGSRIDFVLGDGRGSEEVDIPNLIGLTADEARFSLKGAMLSLGSIVYEGPITDSTNAVIIRQSPFIVDSLSKVKIGTPIHIVVSNKQ